MTLTESSVKILVMLKIRLQRVGRKNDASFRIVVTESTRGPKAGDVVELLGSYDPKQDVFNVKKDRVEYWISVGAQTSDTVNNLFVSNKIIKGDKVNVLPKKSPIVKESGEEDVAQKTEKTPDVAAEKPAEEDEEEKTSETSEEKPVEAKVEKKVEEKKEETPIEEKEASKKVEQKENK